MNKPPRWAIFYLSWDGCSCRKNGQCGLYILYWFLRYHSVQTAWCRILSLNNKNRLIPLIPQNPNAMLDSRRWLDRRRHDALRVCGCNCSMQNSYTSASDWSNRKGHKKRKVRNTWVRRRTITPDGKNKTQDRVKNAVLLRQFPEIVRSEVQEDKMKSALWGIGLYHDTWKRNRRPCIRRLNLNMFQRLLL